MPDWLEIRMPASPERLDVLCAVLTAEGFDSFSIEDTRDFEEYSPYWDYADDDLRERFRDICRVTVYLPDDPSSYTRLDELRMICPGLDYGTLAEENWAEAWKQYYKPIPIGKRLLIQPAWLEPDNPDNRFIFLSNPGMSFGTGLHATTRMCLDMLEELDFKGKTVLDIGCGSGILSVCAMILGSESAVAVDIDPFAADIASRNAFDNAKKIISLSGDVLTDAGLRSKLGKHDVVFSNIVADVIIELAAFARDHMLPGGRWIVSGIIDERAKAVIDTLEKSGYVIEEHRDSGGWHAMKLYVK